MDLDGDVTAPKGRGIFEVLLGIVRLSGLVAVTVYLKWLNTISCHMLFMITSTATYHAAHAGPTSSCPTGIRQVLPSHHYLKSMDLHLLGMVLGERGGWWSPTTVWFNLSVLKCSVLSWSRLGSDHRPTPVLSHQQFSFPVCHSRR